ncbi:hypothetical protein CERSUDRAFT_85420 [Gelatoporia subvermispora B]|uniref:Uncharacterized protein n=1 Tax=Ceriporiopsis subvermispora (strain B) TaxID=914234 RepID=M2R9M0_CERS8|nr:hypothetical protein CERSUDRAFT_85420 [Gelatoporia subvermispora B]
MHQMKNVIPAIGTTTAFKVNKCRILWIGNQIAGSDISQKRKKHMKSRVVVPEDAGKELGMLLTLGHIARSITNTQVPPMLACTPYQIHAIAARLKTHHRLPHIPKLVRATTGKVMWKMAPGRAFSTIKGATTP